MKLCFVIQRYGLEVAGGAELHCRWLATRLARSHSVEVLTTCALDYIEWKNHYPEGRAVVEGITVERHRVRRPRDMRRFALASDVVFHEEHGLGDERKWVEENGPFAPGLLRALDARRDVDLFLFYCYRYYHSFFGVPLVKDRAILVPTAEEDPAIDLRIFGSLFRAPRALLYLTPEEKSLVEGVSGNAALPSAVVGSGVTVPASIAPDVRSRYGLGEHYLLYVGRIDRNKGVDRLIAYYKRMADANPGIPPLVLVGSRVLDVPDDPRLRFTGFVSEEEKYALIAGCDVLLMPSPYESLSIIVLEAWALGRPVLVNAACKVLEGQCMRSGGGLFYRGYQEFEGALQRLLGDPPLRERLGEAGRRYVEEEYDWDVVQERTEALLLSLTKR